MEWKRKSCVTAGKTWLIISFLSFARSYGPMVTFLFFFSTIARARGKEENESWPAVRTVGLNHPSFVWAPPQNNSLLKKGAAEGEVNVGPVKIPAGEGTVDAQGLM